MELHFKRKNKTIIILIFGEIDHHTSAELRRQTESALAQMGGRNIIFGFEHVTFMDSSGIALVLSLYKRMAALGGTLEITDLPPFARRILKAAGVEKLVSIPA